MQTVTQEIQSNRRMWLSMFIISLACAIGLAWGYFIGHYLGYEDGRHDTIEQIEQQLRENPHRARLRV